MEKSIRKMVTMTIFRNCPVRFGRLAKSVGVSSKAKAWRRNLSPAECLQEPATGHLAILFCR
jgi:hypothetical protein